MRRYIDADKLPRHGNRGGVVYWRDIEAQPTVDVVEVVRCKDCKHNPKDTWFGCPMAHYSETQRPETAWCWKGERREE